ncbi:DUF2244 domain-containing protein [Albidovulum sp.]|uniref:DUF2244 domain-containing protein n=1 Tax=Albidovulum sp. TaxID=1872424 RepID=UPI0039B8E222
MPYRWTDPDPETRCLILRPHRSLTARGFVWFVGGTAALIALPLVAVLGSPVLWGLLPFAVAAVAGLWWALRRNSRDGRLTEELTLTRGRAELVRHEPTGRTRIWSAEPHWVRVEMHEDGGPVEHYLTLKGGGREVEIGAFLSPEERLALRAELTEAFARLRAAPR